jgi:hypothetical protein
MANRPTPDTPSVSLEQLPDINAATIAISISMEHFYNRRRVSSSIVGDGSSTPVAGTVAEAIKRDTTLFGVTKRLLDCDELRAINHEQAAVKEWTYRTALPSFLKPGIHLIPIALVTRFEEELKDRKARIAGHVELLAAVLEERIEAMKPRLADQFNRADYPSVEELREGFSLTWRYLKLTADDRLETLSPALFEEQRQIISNAAQETAREVRGLIRAQAFEAVKRLSERLDAVTSKTGRPSHVHDSAVSALHEFLSLVPHRNVTGDAKLTKALEQLQASMQGVTAEQLNDDQALRAKMAGLMGDVAGKLEALVQEAPVRSMKFRNEAA